MLCVLGILARWHTAGCTGLEYLTDRLGSAPSVNTTSTTVIVLAMRILVLCARNLAQVRQ